VRSRREVGPAESLCFFAGHGEIVGKAFTTEDTLWIYGKRLHNYGKSPFYSWENPLFRLGHGFQFANCECLPEDRRSEVCPVSKTPKIDFIIFFQKAQLHKSHLICFGLWKCLVYFQIQWNINGLLSNGEWNILWFIVICPMAYSILSTYYPMENDIQCFFWYFVHWTLQYLAIKESHCETNLAISDNVGEKNLVMDHSIPIEIYILPSGKHTKTYGTSPFSMGKSTISMAIFNSKLLVYQRVMGSSAFFIMTSWNATFYMLGPRLLIVPPSPGRPPLHPQLGMIYSWFTMVRKHGFKVLTIFSTFKVY